MRPDDPVEEPDSTDGEILDDEEDSAVETDPSQDRTPPSLDFLRFEPPEIADGGAATLLIQTSDDLSGAGSVTGIVSSPSGAATFPFRIDGTSGAEGLFTVRVQIPPKAETGLWFVANLALYDRANNPLINRYTAATVPPGGTIRVTSAESDSTPPEILRVSVERATMSGGEKNRVRVELHDDGSGVAGVRGAFRSASNSTLVPFICQASPDPAVWEGEFTLPAGAECGPWSLQNVRPADVAGNAVVLPGGSPQTAEAGFTVSGGDCDSERPTLVRLTLAPDVVLNDSASEVHVTAELTDPGGKAASFTGWVAGPASVTGQPPMILFSCTRSSQDPGAPWTGKIPVSQYAAKGTWTVRMVRLRDSAMSSRDYTQSDPALAGATFEVR